MNLLPNYILDGIIGGSLYVLVSKFGYDDRWDILRRLGMGAIAGYIIYISGLPDHLVTISIGYIGIDAIEAILIKRQLIPSPHGIQTINSTENTNNK
jgi:hypothetical protein